MTGQEKISTSLVDDAGDHEQVSFGDNSKGRISGLGEISLTNDLSLSNVLFVDSCSYILLSIAQFCDLGLSCTLLTVYFGAPSMFITLWFGFDYGTNPPLGTLII
jgi:hypothetical protein